MSRPSLLTQLDDGTSTAGVDCSPITQLNAMRYCSDGKAGPQNHAQLPLMVHEVRNAARNTQQGFMMQGDTLEVYQSAWWRHEFTKHGLTPPRVTYRHNVGWGTLLDRLRRGDYVHLAIDYGVLHRSSAPLGSLSFFGDHSIGVCDPYKHRWHLYGHIGDPLFDGRTRWAAGRWHTYPKGYQGVRLIHYRAAAGAWGSNPPGSGRATAIFLSPR